MFPKALIVPKVHYADLFELDDELAVKAILLAKRLAERMKDALGCDGFNLVQNNGRILPICSILSSISQHATLICRSDVNMEDTNFTIAKITHEIRNHDI